MIEAFLAPLRHEVADTARRASFGVAGALCLGVGAGFLTVAGWIILSLNHGAMIAALVIGLIYMGVGLVLIAVSGRSRRRYRYDHRPHLPPRPSGAGGSELINAFLGGVNAGKALRRR